jgi:PAS domain S-box-containing protein
VTEVKSENLEQRVLVLPPTRKDAELTQSLLERAGIACHCCTTLEQVCEELDRGAAAVLVAEEPLVEQGKDCLIAWLARQPPWADLPVLVTARSGADSAAVAQALDLLGNVTVLERPTRVAALVSTVRTALRARLRQYQAREELEARQRDLEAQAFLGAIISSSDDAIISKSLEGVILTWNAGAERVFGYKAAETIGRPVTMLMPPERQDEEPKLLERLRRGERIEHYETVRVTKDGRLIDISLTLSPVRSADGRMIAASKVARDITERKKAEIALREADRHKDEFLATLAHELRNPLAPIRNSLHLLRMAAPSDATAQRVCEMMERQVNHLVRLVDDLMEVSRITRGLIDLRDEETDLATVLRSAIETSKPLIEAAEHQLAISIPSEPIPLRGDAVRLSQVFSNLLNNAAKYTDGQGQISLSARREGREIVVSVRDSGIGIPTSMLPAVFKMFVQADRSTNRSQGGLGIGLTLAKRLVEMHGGTITAHSAGAGQGSEFVVRLPIATVEAPRAVPLVLEEKPKSLPQRRVLVVDDNEDAAASMGMLLKFLGTQVQVAHDGETALKIIERDRPDVVLLDIGMPGMDGFEVARRVRQRVEVNNIMLIALTGWGQAEDRDRTRGAGFDHHLVKPADITALQSLLVSGSNN